MAEPTDPQELAVVQAREAYTVASAALEGLEEVSPNATWSSSRVDDWLINAADEWTIYNDNLLLAGVPLRKWYKLARSFLQAVAAIPIEKVDEARREYNILAREAAQYEFDVILMPMKHVVTPITAPSKSPVLSRQVSVALPAPSTSKVAVPQPIPIIQKPVVRPSTMAPLPSSPIHAVTPTSPLHVRGKGSLKTVVATSVVQRKPPSTFRTVNAASRPQVIPGPSTIPDEDDEEEDESDDEIKSIGNIEDDRAPSSFPTKIAGRLRIPTVMVSPRRSTRPHNPSPMKAIPQVLTSKKVKRSTKEAPMPGPTEIGKGKAKEMGFRKHPHDEVEDGVGQASSSKKTKIQADTAVEGDTIRVTKAVRARGPGPSKLLVNLDVSNGGFGEVVPSSARPVDNGITSIGVVKVEADFGEFVQVDNRYWHKEVAAFIGERYSKPCDQCKRRRTQCRKLLTYTVICARCHYAKRPCTIDGEVSLNPVDYYRPSGATSSNTFEGVIAAIEQNNNTIDSVIQQYLSGLSVLSYTDNVRAQLSCLRECLSPGDGEDKGEDNDIRSEGSDD
ncbi:uncharacterized protein BT62DRAFT_930900 [Guyanagaster necrorhizus]|uniref:Zn(2)-C6 fungal-type domain-containing protein n=1 Tax=Guyanagaster necrorhizus TaxID=856835 RepID=A0A9P8AU32_9AGAR|nr:uncharacterized protein BT62DRAFT_930900 [Guyanagaster necrorhizus MCA 3950]KAG7447860.1 hypothetical protein BT62DRAFT_930900 [Guyanagaster necrorhizus MCA 3950]